MFSWMHLVRKHLHSQMLSSKHTFIISPDYLKSILLILSLFIFQMISCWAHGFEFLDDDAGSTSPVNGFLRINSDSGSIRIKLPLLPFWVIKSLTRVSSCIGFHWSVTSKSLLRNWLGCWKMFCCCATNLGDTNCCCAHGSLLLDLCPSS